MLEMSTVSLAAALAVGIAGVGVTLGEAGVARIAIQEIGKSPRLSNTMLVYTVLGIALVETGVIYGLVVAFSIFGAPEAVAWNLIAAGLLIGVAGGIAGYAEGKVVCAALEAVNRNPEIKGKILQYMVLFVALVETAAIYALTVSLRLLQV